MRLWYVDKDKAWLWIARRMPHQLVMWCTVVLGAHAITGKYENTVVPELTFMDALGRWEKDHRIIGKYDLRREKDARG